MRANTHIFLCTCLLFFVAFYRVNSEPSPFPSLPPQTTTASVAAAVYPHGRDRQHNYEILKDEVHYSGWRKVVRRSVTINDHPHQRIIDFDVIDQAQSSGGAVIVFAWNSTSKTATIIREYMPGPHRVLSGLAAGIVEVGKHSEEPGEETSLVAARYELEEEWYVDSDLLVLTCCRRIDYLRQILLKSSHLAGGKWFRLTEDGVSGKCPDQNRVHASLLQCIDGVSWH